MNNEQIKLIFRHIYCAIALISFNMIAFVYDAEWIQAAAVLDGAIIVSVTGITLNNVIKK